MSKRVHSSPNLIYSIGSQVVTLEPIFAPNGRIAHPSGAVGVVIKAPLDRQHAYRIRFLDGYEESFNHSQIKLLAEYKEGELSAANQVADGGLYDRVIFRCVIGSRAYGLDDEHSDIDRRGIYLPNAAEHWSLYGVPDQLENDASQEVYWELQKFVVLALKSNPNILECLYSPIVESATPLALELLEMKAKFLSKLVYQTYSGYVASQFKKMQSDLRNQGKIKWKHVMHLIRLLLSGIDVLKNGHVSVAVGEHREQLLEIKAGKRPWEKVDGWRLALQHEFSEAFANTKLPERPDYDCANQFLIKARLLAIEDQLP